MIKTLSSRNKEPLFFFKKNKKYVRKRKNRNSGKCKESFWDLQNTIKSTKIHSLRALEKEKKMRKTTASISYEAIAKKRLKS